ncbi:MAG: CPBP family intramembrane metalloprotease [Deltaproteobacteria bacterium]|nr:CPBP family intramembrane metalloprotease [Deltaproteobacteria bacterium]
MQEPPDDQPLASTATPLPAETSAPEVSAVPRTRLKPWQGLVAALIGGSFGMIASLVVGLMALAALLFAQLGSLNVDHLEADITGLSMSLWVVAPSLFASHGTLFGVPFLTAKLAKVPIRSALGLNGARWPIFLAAPLGILGLGPTSDGIVHLMRWLAPNFTFGTLGQLDVLMQGHSFFVLWPLIALVPGFAEEMFFRGLVQRCLGNGLLAIVVSGVSFACFHMDPHHVAGVLPVGLYLAWVAARADSTWPTIVAHTINNSLALVATKFLGESVGQDEPNPWIILGGLAITALAIATIYWVTRKSNRAGDSATQSEPA